MSPGLGVTNLTSEKWRGEELGSESSLRAGEGKGMRIVRGWHGTTFYLAHQSNINELMTSQEGTHQYLATLRSGHNLVSDVRINSSGESVVTNHLEFSQNYGETERTNFYL